MNLTQNQKIAGIAAGVLLAAGGGVTAAVLSSGGGGAAVGLSPTDPTVSYATGCRDSFNNRGPCDNISNCGMPFWGTPTNTITTPYTYTVSGVAHTTTDIATERQLTNDVPDISLVQPATTQTVTTGTTVQTNTYNQNIVTVPPCDIESQPRQDSNPIAGCPTQNFVAGADQPYQPGCEPLGGLSQIDFYAALTATTAPTITTVTVPPPPLSTTVSTWACKPWETTFSQFWRSSIYHATYVKSWAAEDAALLLYEQTGQTLPAPVSKMGKAWLAAITGGCG
jgi:hypothetical protein